MRSVNTKRRWWDFGSFYFCKSFLLIHCVATPMLPHTVNAVECLRKKWMYRPYYLDLLVRICEIVEIYETLQTILQQLLFLST